MQPKFDSDYLKAVERPDLARIIRGQVDAIIWTYFSSMQTFRNLFEEMIVAAYQVIAFPVISFDHGLILVEQTINPAHRS